jgi:osmoprotectant transport system permease protein
VRCLLVLALLFVLACSTSLAAEPLRVGSKTFTESYVLAELASQRLEMAGYSVERKTGLGGTMIVWEALRAGEIDLYPEYSGTLAQAILQRPTASRAEIEAELEKQGLQIVAELGFNNSYAIAVNGALARERGLTTISQLASQPNLRLGFSLEFLNRAEGWPALSAFYGLPQSVIGLEHALAYRAIKEGQLDATDAYTTDGDLDQFDLVLLQDDKQFFPRYDAILIARNDVPDSARSVLASMHNSLNEASIRQLNANAGQTGVSPAQVVATYLGRTRSNAPTMLESVARNTYAHLQLTLTALGLACLFAVPLALLLTTQPRAAATTVYLAGLLQTIPSLALLAMLIPLFGLGKLPAIIALFLYSLLPIIRNTLIGIAAVDPLLRDVAEGMGMSQWQRLRRVEIPLALPTILAGIKTAAIISIGTATLAAFVGAGGLGEPIITGLNLNDTQLILQGAIPAAMLAIITEFLFEWLERVLVPSQLRGGQ